jgi:hypothetical protein
MQLLPSALVRGLLLGGHRAGGAIQNLVRTRHVQLQGVLSKQVFTIGCNQVQGSFHTNSLAEAARRPKEVEVSLRTLV